MSRKAQRRTPAKAGLWTAITTATQSKAAKRHTKRRTGNASITSEHCAPRLPPSPGNAYTQRSKTLVEIGFNSYPEYLASDLWRSIRASILHRDNRKCRMCSKQATEVHHASYAKDVMLGENHGLLASVCNDCHCVIERNSDGTKTLLTEANRRFGILAAASKKKKRKWKKGEDRRKIFTAATAAIVDTRPAHPLSKREKGKRYCPESPRIPIINNSSTYIKPGHLNDNPTSNRWLAVLAARKMLKISEQPPA